MLDINKIQDTNIFDNAWKTLRGGKITASPAGVLIGDKSHLGIFTKGAISYLQGLAGERITGKGARAEFSNDATDHGNAMEPEAIKWFSETTGLQTLRNEERGDTHRLIIEDDYQACTPDALVALEPMERIFDGTGRFLKVAPLETKCPPRHHRFIKLFNCETPHDLKKAEKNYYWQVCTQMLFCNSLIGYFCCYNEDYNPKGKIIIFNQMDLFEDFKKLKDTFKYAKEELIRIENLFSKN